MHSKTSAATTALSVHRTRSKNQPPLRSTHRRRTPRPQLNLKLPADVIDSFRAFCSERGISQRAAIEAALDAFMRGVDHVASCVSEEVKDGRQNQGDNGPAIVGTPCLSVRPDAERRTDTETAADTRADHRGDGSLECRSFGHPVSSGSDSSHAHLASHEIAEMQSELAAIRSAFPRMLAWHTEPTPATAANVLRYARRGVPDAQPAEVAWYLRRRVMHGAHWRTWGGVVVAAGDYMTPVDRLNVATVDMSGKCAVSFEEWRGVRAATEELWDEFFGRAN
jgi:hypothetical protein